MSSPYSVRAKAILELRNREESGRVVRSPYQVFQDKYRDDPAAFARDCLIWGSGNGLASYQARILGKLPTHRRVCVRSLHGVGKTTISALAVLWFALTRDSATDWKVISTAGSWRQLTKYFWPEVHKWARRIKWAKVGRPPFRPDELLMLNLQMSSGEAMAAASNNSDLIEGAHATEILYVYDEAKSIQAGTWDASEGAFSTGSAYSIACSTPGEPSGRFYQIQKKEAGFEDWEVDRVSLEEAIAAGRVKVDWVESRRKQWGEKSSVFQNRVLGEFASQNEDSVIPLSWVEAAQERYLEMQETGLIPNRFTHLGIDVARYGNDKTVFAPRADRVVHPLRYFTKNDTMETSGNAAAILSAHPGCIAVVDVIGLGAGVVDRLRELGFPVQAFNASAHTDQKDSIGEYGFTNCRSAGWWTLREQLNPDSGQNLALPPDDLLLGDLTAPTWQVRSGGRIEIESKDKIKERIGRSTDSGDAVVQAFFYYVGQPSDEELSSYAAGTMARSSVPSDLLAYAAASGVVPSSDQTPGQEAGVQIDQALLRRQRGY